MALRLVLVFTIVPIVELFLLVKIGGAVGLAPTLLLVVGTGALGAWLTRIQGLRVLREIRTDMEEGVMPAAALLDGALIAAAGLLLLTPGLLTDACGFLLLVPAIRARIRRALGNAIRRRFGPPGPPTIDINP